MKKLFTLITCAVLASSVYAAADKREKLQEKLNLNEQQIEPVNEILDSQKEKRKTIFAEHRERLQADMEKLHEESMQLLSKELTGEQLAEFDKLHEERKAKREQKREERKAKREERAKDET